jgi:RNA polymerase sigma-B factor
MSGEIKRHFRDRCWVVRPPRSLLEIGPRVERTQASLSAALGRPATAADVARTLELDERIVREAIHARTLATVDSLSPADGDEDAPVPPAVSVEDDGYARAEQRATLKPLLRTLQSREREIVRLRFVEDRTQTEIADAIGVSQMHVSRLLREAVGRLRTMAQAA